MMGPEKLHEATEKALYNLTADESLKQRILQKAAAAETDTQKRRRFTSIPAFCTVMAALMLILVVMNGLQPVDPAASVEINVFSAGSSQDVSVAGNEYADVLDNLDPNQVVSVELTDVGTVSDPEACASLVSLLQHNSVSSDYSIEKAVHTLYIISSDGSSLSFVAEEPYLSSGSTWSCVEFFDRLHHLIGQ